jgi:DNA-binding transcriptional ArsR family regulator
LRAASDSTTIESAMVRFVFSVEDLVRTRFAVSPMFELVRSLVALRDPSHAAVHVPWLRSLSGRLQGLDLKQAVALLPPRGYSPDFIMPPPSGPLGSIEEDLAALRATRAAQIRDEMELFRAQHPKAGETVDRWVAHPRREVGRLADMLEAYWQRAVEPVWPRVRAFLDADIAYRSRRLTEAGPAALFADLGAGIAWADRALEVVVARHEATIELEGRGLLLMPSAFSAVRPLVIDRAPWQTTLVYPARGVATLWEDAPLAPEGLARLLGTTRAAVLGDLAAPRSTTEISERLKISPAGASHHLTALRDAGLLAARRDGRSVLYVRTSLGDALVTRPREG